MNMYKSYIQVKLVRLTHSLSLRFGARQSQRTPQYDMQASEMPCRIPEPVQFLHVAVIYPRINASIIKLA